MVSVSSTHSISRHCQVTPHCIGTQVANAIQNGGYEEALNYMDPFTVLTVCLIFLTLRYSGIVQKFSIVQSVGCKLCIILSKLRIKSIIVVLAWFCDIMLPWQTYLSSAFILTPSNNCSFEHGPDSLNLLLLNFLCSRLNCL